MKKRQSCDAEAFERGVTTVVQKQPRRFEWTFDILRAQREN